MVYRTNTYTEIVIEGVIALEEYFWDTQLDYMKSTRTKMWNDDYFEFCSRKKSFDFIWYQVNSMSKVSSL